MYYNNQYEQYISFVNVRFWMFPPQGHLWYLARRFVFTQIASIFVKQWVVCIELCKCGEISAWNCTPQNLWLSSLWLKNGFNVRAMFAQSHFAPPLLNNISNHFFAWTIYHFNCLPILEVDIIRITNHDYDKYFSIFA